MRAHTFKEMKEIPPHTLKEMKEIISIVAWVKSQWVPGMTQAIWNSVVATTQPVPSNFQQGFSC